MTSFFEALKAKSQQAQPIQEEESQEPSAFFESLKQSPSYQQNPEPSKEESGIGYVGRQIARTGVRAAETIGGMIGDISKAPLEHLEEQIVSRVTKKPLTKERRAELQKINPVFGGASQVLPTSQGLRKAHEPYTGEYLKPQTPGEERSDEFVQDVTSLVSQSGAGAGKILGSIGRSALIGLVGQGAKEISKGIGQEEEGQELAKSGGMFLASLWNPKKASKLASDYYAARESALPVGVTGDATKLESKMLRLANKMRRSGKNIAPSEQEIAEAAENVVSEIANGKMSYQKAASMKRSLNEKAKKFLFESKDKAAKARARKQYKAINHTLEEFIETSANKHPEFYKAHKKADEIFGALAAGEGVSRFLESNLPRGLSTVADKIASGILKPGALVYHIWRSPELRKLYLNMAHSAAIQNTPQMLRNFNRLEKEVEEDPEIRKILESE